VRVREKRSAVTVHRAAKGGRMKKRRPRIAGWGAMILSFVLLTLAFATSRTTAAGPAGAFPDLITMPGVTARGVAVDRAGNVYVSVEETRSALRYIQLRKFTPAGEQLFAVEIGEGTIGGLMVTANGDLYIALAAGADRGVYRMDRDGEIELLPGSSQIFFANGLAFDEVGNLWVTESVSMTSSGPGQGGVWRIPREGSAELCVRDELLTGTGALGQPVPIGANGIVYYHGNLYMTNTEKGTVLRMRVWPDGSFAPLELWTTLQEVPESPLAGSLLPVAGDGIALDVYGNLYVAVLTRAAIVRLDLVDKSQATAAAFRIPDSLPLHAGLDFPASLVFGTGMAERTNLFVTNIGMAGWVGPSLVKIDVGVPGRPLR
jgi:sugar lactone lactonase YvrE